MFINVWALIIIILFVYALGYIMGSNLGKKNSRILPIDTLKEPFVEMQFRDSTKYRFGLIDGYTLRYLNNMGYLNEQGMKLINKL